MVAKRIRGRGSDGLIIGYPDDHHGDVVVAAVLVGSFHQPGGSFIEGRKAATLGIRGNYQNAWELDLSYTTFWGADRHNLLTDRDFIGLNGKFSF